MDHVFGRLPTEIREPRIKDNSIDDIIEQNGKQPIFFDGSDPLKSSVAGISFDMSYEEASKILSPPTIGGCGSIGDFYRENLCLLWTEDEPRVLRQAYIIGGYLGSFDFPEPIGLQPPRAELSQFFKDELGVDLIVKTYNKLFNKDQNYNCIEEKTCQALPYNQYINWILPNVTLVFSKDRKVFVSVIISQDVRANPASLDILKGQMDYGSETLKLGQTWSEAKDILNPKAEPRAIVETSTYRKDYLGMVLRLRRNGVYQSQGQAQSQSFDVNQLEPLGNETVNSIIIYSDYNQPIRINNKYVRVLISDTKDKSGQGSENLGESEQEPVSLILSESPCEVEVGLTPGLTPQQVEATKTADVLSSVSPACQGTMLTVRMDQFAKRIDLQKSLIRQLKRVMKAQFNQAFGEKNSRYVFSQRLYGLEARQAPNRILELFTEIYDSQLKKSFTSTVIISYNGGNLSFRVNSVSNPFESSVVQSTKTPLNFSSPEMGGFRLGQVVKLTAIDRIKSEGFFELNGKSARAAIDLFSSNGVSYYENESTYVSQPAISIPNLAGVTLGLSPLQSITQDTKEISAEIVYLSSQRNTLLPIANICNIASTPTSPSSSPSEEVSDSVAFSPQFGMLQSVFTRGIKEKLKKGQASCEAFFQPDADGDLESSVLYFPGQSFGQKLIFSERVLIGVAKYKKPGVPVPGVPVPGGAATGAGAKESLKTGSEK